MEVRTKTSDEQHATEEACALFFEKWTSGDGELMRHSLSLAKAAHINFLNAGRRELSGGYSSLDASRPWICYWILHALEMLGAPSSDGHDQHVVDFLASCQDPSGGFCGGPFPGQLPHLAPTYAAVNTLFTIGTENAYRAIDREGLRRFLLRMKTREGGFTMHEDGEADVRGSYTALAVASLCDLMTEDLVSGAAEFVASCQTYEGGIGATPGEEAHGGYTFCGLAAMVLLNKVDQLDLPRMLDWLVRRQMVMHGGFQGRTNKLVDSCYSFWQGGAFPLIQSALEARGDLPPTGVRSLFSTIGLFDYILVCSQIPQGGLRDKPGRGRDYYHTCYALSGYAVCAAEPNNDGSEKVPLHWQSAIGFINPVYNIVADKVVKGMDFFHQDRLRRGATSDAGLNVKE